MSRTVITAGLSALLYALSFPNAALFFLGFVFLIPLLYALDKQSEENRKPRFTRGFFLFFLFSFLTRVLVLYWIPRVMVRYGSMPVSLSILSLILLSAFLSLFDGAAGILIRKVMGGARFLLIPLGLVPAVWVCKDLAVETIFGGFPWCLAGYSQYKNILFVQMGEWGGIHLVTFILIYFNVLFYYLARYRKELWKPVLASIVLSMVMVYTVGFYLYRTNEKSISGLQVHKAGIIQPNVTHDFPVVNQAGETLNRLFRESAELAQLGAEFVVWPEYTVDIYPLQGESYLNRFRRFAADYVPLLAGFTDLQGYKEIYNSAILFSPGGIQKYDKVHLTPFGEYILFRELLFFVKRITDEIADFTPGEAVRNLNLKGRWISTPICYEVIFPGLVRDFVAGGGQLMVTISNDSWFGDTSAPYQHLAMAAFRCIENRRYMLRSTSNGVSGVVGPSGKILYSVPYSTAHHFVASFRYMDKKTIFTRFGYLFPYFCVVWVLVFFWGRRCVLKLRNLSAASKRWKRKKRREKSR